MATLKRTPIGSDHGHARTRAARPLLTMMLVTAASCGDALVDSTFRGDRPLFQIEARIEANNITSEPPKSLRVALFFSPSGPRETSIDRFVEQTTTSIEVPVPSYFVFNVFDVPGAQHMVALPPPRGAPPMSSGSQYAVGRLFAYADSNGNGRHDAAEPFTGLQLDIAYLYAPSAVPAGQSAVSGVLPAGFHRAITPLLCGQPVPTPQTPGSCGVPLGAACASDADCTAAGVCIQNLPAPWPNGACAIPEPPPSGCRPGAGSYYLSPSVKAAASKGYWLKSCKSDEDCVRPGPIRQSAYSCDQGWHACLPRNPDTIQSGEAPARLPSMCPTP